MPNQGWDIIFTNHNVSKIFVEMKNKHNTMNSSSSQKTYLKMQNHILKNTTDECYLVEVLAPLSRNIEWGCSVDSEHLSNKRIRRVSIDNFYEIVTGKKTSFYELCIQLPKTIEKLILSNKTLTVEKDTVIDELQLVNSDTLLALYILAFKNYEGFKNLN